MHQTNSSLKETKTITINSDRSDEMIEGLKMISSKYNLCAGSIIQLRDLERYNIVCLFDDSGSMSTKITKNLVDNPIILSKKFKQDGIFNIKLPNKSQK